MKYAKYLLALFIVLLAVGVCGCKKEPYAEKIRAEAESYLNEHYSDTFMPAVFIPGGWAYEFESITFSSEKYPEERVEVRVYQNDDGTYRFKDNYYHCYMMDSAVEYARAVLGEETAAVKVRFRNTVWSDELDGAETFEQWQARGTACAEFFVITRSTLAADAQLNIVEKIAEDQVSGMVMFLVTDDENLLRDKTLNEILNNQSKFVVGKDRYSIDYDFAVKAE